MSGDGVVDIVDITFRAYDQQEAVELLQKQHKMGNECKVRYKKKPLTND
jgi:hypothetical protein